MKSLLCMNLLSIGDIDNYLKTAGDINFTDNTGRTMLFSDYNQNGVGLEQELDINFNYEPYMIKHLIDCGIDVNHKAYNGNNALFNVNNKKIAELLIQEGIDIHIKNNKNENALTTSDNTEVQNLLFDKGVEVLTETEGAERLFLKTDNVKIVEKYLEKGGNINARFRKNSINMNALYYSLGNLEKLKVLLENNLTVENEEQTLMCLAGCNVNELELLISYGMDIFLNNVGKSFIEKTYHWVMETEQEEEDLKEKLRVLIISGVDYQGIKRNSRLEEVISGVERERLNNNITSSVNVSKARL